MPISLSLFLSLSLSFYPRLEWEQLLEQHTCLQDSFDQLQAETKFEADQARQQLLDSQQDATSLRAHITVGGDAVHT